MTFDTMPEKIPPPPFLRDSTRAPDAKSYDAEQKSHDSTTAAEDVFWPLAADGSRSATVPLVKGILQLGHDESKQYVLLPCRTTATAPSGFVAGFVSSGSRVSRRLTLSIWDGRAVAGSEAAGGRDRQFEFAALLWVPTDGWLDEISARSRSRRLPLFLARNSAVGVGDEIVFTLTNLSTGDCVET
jgi:hypothetical protein